MVKLGILVERLRVNRNHALLSKDTGDTWAVKYYQDLFNKDIENITERCKMLQDKLKEKLEVTV